MRACLVVLVSVLSHAGVVVVASPPIPFAVASSSPVRPLAPRSLESTRERLELARLDANDHATVGGAAIASAGAANAQPDVLERRPRDGRRQLAAAPAVRRLRFHLDSSMLGEGATSDPSACTHVGMRYERGFPTDDGRACGPGVLTDCISYCTTDDLFGEAERARLIALVQAVLDDFDYFAIPVGDDAPLVLTKSAGNHAWWYVLMGLGAVEERCARDCALLSGYHADASLCETGVPNSDVIVAIRAPHVIAEVAASASACHHAANGRPNVVVISWHQSLANLLEGSLADLVERYEGLVRHELLHGIGFLLSEFRKAGLVERITMTDLDGDVDADVWSFKSGTRAHAAAQQHFGCDDPNMALPLMRHPEMGRDQHWSSRAMRDDVMAYGVAKRVSAITLGAIADLGYYTVDFNRSVCLHWGRAQGCAFVATLCGAMVHDHSVSVVGPEACLGLSTWTRYADDHLDDKCAFGADPCGAAAYNAATSMCNAMCAVDEAFGGDACVLQNASVLAFHADHDADDDDEDDGLYLALFWTQILVGMLSAWGLVFAIFVRADVGEYRAV